MTHAHGGHHHENPWAGQGAVLLDIGGDIGALVVTMPPSMVDVEVEIEPVAPTKLEGPRSPGAVADARRHVAVVARPTQAGAVPSLVFPELEQGTYALAVKPAGPVVLTVEVRGGQVSTVDWPGPVA